MSDESQVYCNQSSQTIVKFVGVVPQGLNRLHDAVEAVNATRQFAESPHAKVELLSANYSKPHRSYIVEIGVPFQTSTGQYDGGRKVPQSVMIALFDAVNEFQPE